MPKIVRETFIAVDGKRFSSSILYVFNNMALNSIFVNEKKVLCPTNELEFYISKYKFQLCKGIHFCKGDIFYEFVEDSKISLPHSILNSTYCDTSIFILSDTTFASNTTKAHMLSLLNSNYSCKSSHQSRHYPDTKGYIVGIYPHQIKESRTLDFIMLKILNFTYHLILRYFFDINKSMKALWVSAKKIQYEVPYLKPGKYLILISTTSLYM